MTCKACCGHGWWQLVWRIAAYALGCTLLAALVSPLLAVGAENNRLPDGSTFQVWEQPQRYHHTYHVAQNHAQASDDNPGTAGRPWKTISQAAAVLRPGERVIVHEGVYREWVRPARGGRRPTRMICYQAAPGEEVVLKGSDEWQPEWRPTDNQVRPEEAPVTWRAELPPGAAAFTQVNYPSYTGVQPARCPGFDMRRGQLFLAGEPLAQVATYRELLTTENAFWVEENNAAVHVRLAGDESPVGKVFEITTREQVFAPETRFLSYLKVSGFKIFHAANGVPNPYPQHGAVSTSVGHHWIIEDCEIGYINTLGLDIGGQNWGLAEGNMLGSHIVRRNYVHHCGCAGICGWHAMANQNLLIEDNLISHSGTLPIAGQETAGIKFHRATGSLIRRNVILHNHNCPGLWLDGEITNTRVTQNLIYDTSGYPWGSIIIEATNGPNMIDSNIVLHSNRHGVCTYDTARGLFLQNLIAVGDGSAVYLRPGDPNRFAGGTHRFGSSRVWEDDHRVHGNILANFDRYILAPNLTTACDFNVLGGLNAGAGEPFELSSVMSPEKNGSYALEAWRTLGNDVGSVRIPLEINFDEDKLELSVTAPAEARLPQGELVGLERLPSMAFFGELLQADFLGQPRDSSRLQIGPLVNLPLDGTPIKVDPRHL